MHTADLKPQHNSSSFCNNRRCAVTAKTRQLRSVAGDKDAHFCTCTASQPSLTALPAVCVEYFIDFKGEKLAATGFPPGRRRAAVRPQRSPPRPLPACPAQKPRAQLPPRPPAPRPVPARGSWRRQRRPRARRPATYRRAAPAAGALPAALPPRPRGRRYPDRGGRASAATAGRAAGVTAASPRRRAPGPPCGLRQHRRDA